MDGVTFRVPETCEFGKVCCMEQVDLSLTILVNILSDWVHVFHPQIGGWNRKGKIIEPAER